MQKCQKHSVLFIWPYRCIHKYVWCSDNTLLGAYSLGDGIGGYGDATGAIKESIHSLYKENRSFP